MNAPDTREPAVIVLLPVPDERLPSGPIWTFLDDHSDGVTVVSRPADRQVVLDARALATEGTQAVLRFTPRTTRAVAAALLAAADHIEQQETR
ncbi:hypothetical protein GCM10010174_66580 [Kutzneria viridogrisea]|uniref:Uncharacterized protein n=1 Tax=Kutzneria viridogrisea TaxID=47990 RepID=A0ABR6B9X9_9PSEU|nr:hypothetical protein [Kutzneria viridogrisea]